MNHPKKKKKRLRSLLKAGRLGDWKTRVSFFSGETYLHRFREENLWKIDQRKLVDFPPSYVSPDGFLEGQKKND